MTSVPSSTNTDNALRVLQRAEFTVYRRGEVAFTLESRRQGQIRKVTQASFREEIMADDSIKVTLYSSVTLDFKLRDYILYDTRPYFLNRLPEVSRDHGKMYTYTMTFEGTMFELSRVAFVLDNAFGYDYYGTLPEFCRLIVDNMNRVNMWVEWTYNGNAYKGRFRRKVELTRGGVTKLVYMWGRGFNNDLEGMGERFIYTEGVPVAGAHGIDPEDFSSVNSITVTFVRKWSLDFPKKKTTPTSYPSPTIHIPDSIISYAWAEPTHETEQQTIASINAEANALSWEERIGSYERGLHVSYVANSISYGEIPPATPVIPTSPDAVCVVYQRVTYTLRFLSWWEDTDAGTSDSTYYDEVHHLDREVRYTAEVDGQQDWIVTPIAPPSGSDTQNDYPTESILLAYEQHSCLAVLQDMCSQWAGWEWRVGSVKYGYIDGQMCVCGTIKLAMNDNLSAANPSHILSFGRSGGIEAITRKYASDGNIPSRVYFYGGSQNLPQYYRNTRLCLPNMEKAKSYLDFSQMQGVNFTEGIENTLCEEIITFDDIYPANKPFEIKSTWDIEVASPSNSSWYLIMYIPTTDFFNLIDVWKAIDKEGVLVPDEDDYAEWMQWKGYPVSEDHTEDYMEYYANVSKYRIAGETPMFTFQTGEIGGYSLSVHEFYLDPKSGKYCVILNVVKEPNEEISDDYHVPNEDVCCRIGDKFIVSNIYMPVKYTYYQDGTESDFSAENALWRASVEYMVNKMSAIEYEIEVSRYYSIRNRKGFRCFDRVQFEDINGITVKRRVLATERDLVDGYKFKVTLTNRGMLRPWKAIGQLIANNQQGA